MPGFEFRYRLSGKPPTIETFAMLNGDTISRGDMLNVAEGRVALGRTGDATFIGSALETLDGQAASTSIRLISDADAVYGVEDRSVRDKGATLDLAGPTSLQGVGASVNADFVVDVDSSADEETLVRINGGSHYKKPARSAPQERLLGGELSAAIARAVVRFHADQRGRGPTRAQAFYRNNVMVVVLEGVMTAAERSLLAGGKADAVLHARTAFQETMRAYLTSTVERLSGCKVRAFMSANHLDPDLAAEVFVLDRPLSEGPAQADSPSTL